MNHDRCPRAIFQATDSPMVAARGEWRCVGCAELLAIGTDLHLRGDLIPLNVQHGNIAAYGLPDRVRVHRRTARSAAYSPANHRGWQGPVSPPVYVYCPRSGVCGRGQHIEVPSQ